MTNLNTLLIKLRYTDLFDRLSKLADYLEQENQKLRMEASLNRKLNEYITEISQSEKDVNNIRLFRHYVQTNNGPEIIQFDAKELIQSEEVENLLNLLDQYLVDTDKDLIEGKAYYTNTEVTNEDLFLPTQGEVFNFVKNKTPEFNAVKDFVETMKRLRGESS